MVIVNIISFKHKDWIFPFRFDYSIKTECYCKYPPWMVLLSSRLRMCFEHLRFLYNKYRSWHLIHHYKSNIFLSGKVNIWNLSEPFIFSLGICCTHLCLVVVGLSIYPLRRRKSIIYFLASWKLILPFCDFLLLPGCLQFMKNSRVVLIIFPFRKSFDLWRPIIKNFSYFADIFEDLWLTLILHFTFI